MAKSYCEMCLNEKQLFEEKQICNTKANFFLTSFCLVKDGCCGNIDLW
jgi:hypothetical protein